MTAPTFLRPAIAASLSDAELGLVTEEILQATDLIELRVDWFGELRKERIRDVFLKVREFGKPIIGTLRDHTEGGRVHISPEHRLSLYSVFIPLADLLDVEIRSEIFEKVRNEVKTQGRLLIGSYHNFNHTPEERALTDLCEMGFDRGADLVKIATLANTYTDFLRLARLTINYPGRVVTLCMGRMSLLSRVLLPFIGSCFTFGAVGEEKAPGQPHLLKLRSLMDILSNHNHTSEV